MNKSAKVVLVQRRIRIALGRSCSYNRDLAAEADKFLTAPESEVPPALRRLVLEGQAGVKRSLKARQFDGAAD